MKGNRLTYRIVLSVMLLSLLLAGCGKQASAGDEKVRIFLALNQMDTFRKTFVEAAQAKAQSQGMTLDYLDAEGSIENQVAQLKQAAKDNYDVILCSAVSRDTAVQLKMSAGDIPIIFFNSCPDDKYLEAGKYMYVGSNEQVAGAFQAEYVLNKMAGKQEINVVMIEGPRGHSATSGRTNGVKKALQESGKEIKYVFEDSADWDTAKAQKVFSLFQKTGVQADCVICNNDAMALGVIKACKESGTDFASLPILGVDATADGCSAIRNGEMAFTVYQSGVGQGEAAVDMALRLVGHGKIEDMEGISEDGKYVWVDFEKVDSSNVSEYEK